MEEEDKRGGGYDHAKDNFYEFESNSSGLESLKSRRLNVHDLDNMIGKT